MKSLKKVTGILSVLLLAGSFFLAGCSNGDSGDDAKEEITATELKSGDTYTVSAGADAVEVYVAGKTAADFSEENLTITAVEGKKGYFTIQASKDSLDAEIPVNFYDAADDNDEGIDLTVKIENTLFVLTVTLDEAIAVDAETLSVTYKNSDAETAPVFTADVSYTAKSSTAKVYLLKANSDAYGFLNNIVYTVKDSSENTILVASDQNAWVCHYSTNADYYTEVTLSAPSEKTAPVTINFTGFTLSATDTVSVTYGAADNTDTVTAEIASDGASASLEVSNAYINNSGYFELVVTITKDGDEFTSFTKSGNGWFKFEEAGITETLTIVDTSEVWSEEVKTEVSGSSTPIQIITADQLAGYSKVKIATSGASDSLGWWASVYNTSDAEFAEKTEIKLDWDTNYSSGYSAVITDLSPFTDGIYLAGGFTAYYISYVEKAED